MARSSHQDTEEDAPQEVQLDGQQAESVQAGVEDQPLAQQNIVEPM